jgi:glycosyltransferase involved in cell wall biosynthesis
MEEALMKILVFISDRFAPAHYRIFQPLTELKRFGVSFYCTPLFPSSPDRPGPDFNTLVEQVSNYDLCIVQRVINGDLIQTIKGACFLNNIPLLFEVDDDYLGLERSNPCYYSPALDSELLNKARELQIAGKYDELAPMIDELEAIREAGLQSYKRALALFDGITCTTPELRSTLLPYNKEIEVFPNQMETVHYYRDYNLEECDEKGNMKRVEHFGMVNIPSHYTKRDVNDGYKPILEDGKLVPLKLNRYGYSGTLSHRDDFMTIKEGLNKFAAKHAQKCHIVYMGDPWFYHQQEVFTGTKTEENPEGDGRQTRRQWIPETDIPTYIWNLRNLDAAYAPLFPVPFNQSKSDLKALEYASWGICPILPNFITYTRSFEHGKTALFYSTPDQFMQCLEWCEKNPTQMAQIGKNARQYVAKYRLESQHAKRRFKYYESVIAKFKKFKPLVPNKEKLVV